MFKIKNLVYIGVVLVGIQFIPYGKNHTNPIETNIVKWDSAKTEMLFEKACADCHSNKTKWTWYTNVAPMSWLAYYDVKGGRKHFNISESLKTKKVHDAIEEIEEDEMPVAQYTMIHQDAKLTEKEKKELISGLKKTFLN